MKFDTNSEQLHTAISTAVRFSDKRPNLPVLGSVLLVADGNRLTVRATNLECGVEIHIPAKIITSGVAAVPAGTLSSFLHTLRSKTLSASLEGEVLHVETERASTNLKTIPHDDFPVLPKVSAEKSFTTKGSEFSRLIRSVAYCASTSTVKPELQAVLLYGEGGKLFGVATDSFRLAEKTIVLKSAGSVPQLLLPARNAAELVRLMESEAGDVELYYNENQISAHIGAAYYTSRLIDGTFPNYRQIIPKTFSTEVVMLREDLSSSLKSLSVFADKFSQVSLSIEPKEKTAHLSSRNPDVGEQTSTLHVTVSGEQLSMSFNGRYLADSLQSIVGEQVRVSANGPGKPIVIKDAADESFLYLAMPMNR